MRGMAQDPTARVTLGVLVGAIALGLLLNGAVAWWAQALMHLGLAVGLGLALRIPDARLSLSGRGLRLLVLPALVTLVAASSLIPLPPDLLATLAPGTAAAFPDRWHPMALDPAGVGRGLSLVSLLVGVIVGVSASSPRRQRGLRPERHAAVAALVLAVLYFVHLGLRPDAMYGLLPVAAERGAASAPLVNRNFVGTLGLVLTVPVVGGLLRAPGRNPGWRGVLWAGAVAGVAVVIGTGSVGVLLVGSLLVLGLVATRLLGRWGWLVAVPVAPLGAVVGVLAEGWLRAETSADMRADQWARSLPMFLDFPILGTGLGGYAEGFGPYGPPLEIVRYTHLHNDPYQWLLELGPVAFTLCGLALLAALFLPSGPRALVPNHPIGQWLALAALAVLLHSLVDFPLQMPALLAMTMALVAAWLAGFTAAREVSAGIVRAFLVVGLLFQVGAAGLVAWLGHVERAAPELLEGTPEEASIAWIETLAPWRAEPALARARAAARDGEGERAVELARQAAVAAPDDPVVLLNAGAVMAVGGALDAALQTLGRATERLPADHRPYALASRVAEARGDDDEAIRQWALAIRRWPHSRILSDRPFDRALSLRPVGLWWLEQLEDGPQPYLSATLGYALLDRGEPADALIAFDQAALLSPRYAWIPRKGLALHRIGRSEEALQFLVQADAHDRSGESRMRRATILLDLDRPAEARDDAYAALRENPDIPQARLIVLQATARIDGPEEALERADLLIGRRGRPSLREALFLGETADALGRQPECLRWLAPHVEERAEARRQAETCRKNCITCAADGL